MDKALILKGIADNPVLMEELKKLFIEEFDLPMLPANMPNEQLGEIVRANISGRRAIEIVFNKILEYRTPLPKTEGKHPGR